MTDAERRRAVAERAARAGAAVAADGFRADLAVERKDGKTDVVTQADRDAQRRVVEVIREAFPDDTVVGEEDTAPGAAEEAGDDEPGAVDARKTVPASGAAWIIDPIDGTNNFVRDLPVWATSVAAVVDGEPVAAANVMPALDDAVVAGAGGATRNGEPTAVTDTDDPEQFAVVPTYWWEFDDREAYARATRAVVTRFGDLRRFGSAQATFAMVAAGGVDGVLTNRRMNPWDSVAGVHLVRQAGGTVTDLAGDRWTHDSEGLVASNGECHETVLSAAREI